MVSISQRLLLTLLPDKEHKFTLKEKQKVMMGWGTDLVQRLYKELQYTRRYTPEKLDKFLEDFETDEGLPLSYTQGAWILAGNADAKIKSMGYFGLARGLQGSYHCPTYNQ